MEARGLKPEEVLQELMAGNERFVNGNPEHPRCDEPWLGELVGGQRPVAVVFACSDSRVPLERIFDQGFGDLFVIRVAGNVLTREGVGSMQYALANLGTQVVIVLGHESCGAVQAALMPDADKAGLPAGIRDLLAHVVTGDSSHTDGPERIEAAIETNAKTAAQQILDLDPNQEGFSLPAGTLVVSAVYEISTRRVRILDQQQVDLEPS